MTTKAWRIRLTSDLERNEGQSARLVQTVELCRRPIGAAGADNQELFSNENGEVFPLKH